MSEPYVPVPETAEVRERFVNGKSEFMHSASWIDDYAAEFDAWIAQHDRQVKAEAWDEAMQDAYDRGRIDQLSYEDSTNPYRIESQETP